MSKLCHALLTEDEAVLLKALDPTQTDRIVALFAYGNGDAAISLLQTSPKTIAVHDIFDQPSLTAQIRLKQWLFENLECTSLRNFVGIEAGFDVAKRSEIIKAMLRELHSSDRAFWLKRIDCLRKGMANSDSTYKWTRGLRCFLAMYGRLPFGIRSMMLRLGMPFVSLFFPREERIHSLGYQQMKQHPVRVMERLIDSLKRINGVGYVTNSIVPYQEFKYLSFEGHAAIRKNFHRIQIIDKLHHDTLYNKIYLSNLIDYVSTEDFYSILNTLLPVRRTPWTMFLNSTYESATAHPHLQVGIEKGLFSIDWQLTNALRYSDRIGVYPGLTVVRGT